MADFGEGWEIESKKRQRQCSVVRLRASLPVVEGRRSDVWCLPSALNGSSQVAKGMCLVVERSLWGARSLCLEARGAKRRIEGWTSVRRRLTRWEHPPRLLPAGYRSK